MSSTYSPPGSKGTWKSSPLKSFRLQSLPESAGLSLDQVNQDATAYLLPDYEDGDEQQLLLAQYYDLIFKDQLAGW